MVARSGLNMTIIMPHTAKSMTNPSGAMYFVSSKNEMSRPTISLKKATATAPRAAPSSVMTLPAAAAYAMPMNSPLPNFVGFSGSSYKE